MEATITVLTTSRNRRELLRQTLASVLAQEWPRIEQVVVDANSSDGTRELLKEYEARYAAKGGILRWISEPDSGQAEAMNKGLRMATGDFFVLLNDDDVLEPGALPKFMQVFAEHPDVDFVYGDNYAYYADTGERKLVRYESYSLDDMLNK